MFPAYAKGVMFQLSKIIAVHAERLFSFAIGNPVLAMDRCAYHVKAFAHVACVRRSSVPVLRNSHASTARRCFTPTASTPTANCAIHAARLGCHVHHASSLSRFYSSHSALCVHGHCTASAGTLVCAADANQLQNVQSARPRFLTVILLVAPTARE